MGNIFLSILGISVSIGLLVIGLILLSPFLNKRYAAKWKYLIWIFIALRLLVPFSGVNGPYIIDRISQRKVQTTAEPEENNTDNTTDITTPYRRIVVEIPAQMTTPIIVPTENDNTSITMLDILAFVWVIGGLLFMSVHLFSFSYFKRQVMKKGKVIKDAPILSQMFQLKHELHIKRSVCLMEYYEAESPMIIGFIKPVLVLPKEQYSSEDLFFILKHELVHLKRGDVYIKLLFLTANAVHWFNPLIWLMQKEAVIDMELSCDERVTQGTSYALRKAYTETLLSMLHKRCVRKTVLSTQFYGGTKIMKKRFKNILIKRSKKNGIPILICAVVLTISLGTLIGCSVTKEDMENENSRNEDTANENTTNEGTGSEDTGNVPGQTAQEADQTEMAPVDNSSADNHTLENTITLIFSKEGEQEQKPATLAIGNGYSFYLPDDEQWHQSAPDLWTTEINEQVALWITHYEGESVESVNQKLQSDGYAEEDSLKWRKQEGDLIYHAEQKVFDNNVWGIFYSYPVDFEEGWGREFPVITNTFALSDAAYNNEATDDTSNAGDYLSAEDCQEIRTIVDAFAAAYFDGNANAIPEFLASTYVGNIDTYEGIGTISDLTVKGLSDTDEKKIENGTCSVSIEFRDSNYEDMFLYLTIILAREEDSWKIQFYDVEG